MNEIEIHSPATFERAARRLKGGLAGAIAGAGGQVAARALFMGERDVVSGASRWLTVVAWLNRIPVFTWPLRALAYRNRLYGNLLTTMLFAHKRKGDKVILQSDEDVLSSVRLIRDSGENIEFTFKNLDKAYILQTLHFGKKLADGSDRLTIKFVYDNREGTLRSAGSIAIDEQNFFERESFALGSREIDEAMLLAYEKLVGHSGKDSLTFPINCGVLEYALKFLQRPELGVDFQRVAVYGLEFSRDKCVKLYPGDAVIASVAPVSVKQTDKGQLLTAELLMSTETEICRCRIAIMVRSNFPKEPDYRPEHIVLRNLWQEPGGRSVDMTFMKDDRLLEFASLNGDHNPLHQIDSVARIVGFHKKINPGLGIVAEIETALRGCLEKPLKYLSATLIRPVYPGRRYSLQFNPKGRYQLVKKGKVLADGRYNIYGNLICALITLALNLGFLNFIGSN